MRAPTRRRVSRTPSPVMLRQIGKRSRIKPYMASPTPACSTRLPSPVLDAIRRLQYTHFRYRYDELSAPFPDAGHLRHDLVLEVPGQDQEIVGPRLADLVGVQDGDVRAREQLPLLVRVAV